MGRCTGCGREDSGYVGGYLCYQCKKKLEQEKANAYNKKYGAHTGGTGGYRPAANSWQTNASVHRSGSGLTTLIIIAIVIIGVFLGIRYLKFRSTEGKLEDSFEITAPMSGDGSDFVNEILSRDNTAAVWSMKITEYPSDYWKTLYPLTQKSAFVKGYMQDGETVWKYDFADADAGTGLKGVYYLAAVNGTRCMVDDGQEVLYPEGSAFYEEHYDALSALQYDTLLPKLTEGLTGGVYGSEKQDQKVVLKGEQVSASVYDDGYHKTRILDERGDVRVQYELNYYESSAEQLPDFGTYKTAE